MEEKTLPTFLWQASAAVREVVICVAFNRQSALIPGGACDPHTQVIRCPIVRLPEGDPLDR